MYNHIILFKFSVGLTQGQCFQLLDDLGKLQLKIPEILTYHYGINDSDNPHHQGFAYAFIMTFHGKAERQRYQDNPYHLDYINRHLNHNIEDAIVFDMNCEYL